MKIESGEGRRTRSRRSWSPSNRDPGMRRTAAARRPFCFQAGSPRMRSRKRVWFNGGTAASQAAAALGPIPITRSIMKSTGAVTATSPQREKPARARARRTPTFTSGAAVRSTSGTGVSPAPKCRRMRRIRSATAPRRRARLPRGASPPREPQVPDRGGRGLGDRRRGQGARGVSLRRVSAADSRARGRRRRESPFPLAGRGNPHGKRRRTPSVRVLPALIGACDVQDRFELASR